MKNVEQCRFLQASMTPIEDLEAIAIPGQDPNRRKYRTGYENFFEEMPVLNPNDPLIVEKSNLSKQIMQNLSAQMIKDNWFQDPGAKNFARTIVALESPKKIEGGGLKEGAEFVVAHWGEGFSSPVHGHATGYMHEEVLTGKIRVNTYRMLHPETNIVRLVETQIVGPGTFVSQYSQPARYHFKRSILIHNFTALEPTNSLHYLSEHTRDGRDNGFVPEFFEDEFKLSTADVDRVNAQQAMYSQNGEVILVRSTNVPEYGDHYIVITGKPIMKEHGLRPKETAIMAPHVSSLLDQYQMQQGLVLLKLKGYAKKAFHEFHKIEVKDGETVMPQPESLILF